MDQFDLAQFLYQEAALLDSREWDAWGELFTADGIYWIPGTVGQADPLSHVSLVYENSLLREVRLARLKSADAPSLRARPCSSHLISNVVVADRDSSAGRYKVHSRFVVAQYASSGKSVFHGSYTHELRVQDQNLRIALKRVDLVDVDGPLGDIVIVL